MIVMNHRDADVGAVREWEKQCIEKAPDGKPVGAAREWAKDRDGRAAVRGIAWQRS